MSVDKGLEENMKKRILCLVLAVFMLAGCLVACNDTGGGEVDGGDKNGDWANLDFKDARLNVTVSKNQDDEVSFRPGNIYTKGPDSADTAEAVPKKVLARNKKVAEDLNINLVYETVDLAYHEIMPYLELLMVQGVGEESPDVFHNDIYGMLQAMLNGYLWNVSDPGKDIKSYFDFDHACWYKEYMEGATFNKDKMYLLAGDYNLDIIRYAWVIFVNTWLWDSTFADSDYGKYEQMCEHVDLTGDWFYDDIVLLSGMAHNDEGGDVSEKADKNDAQIGLVADGNIDRCFTYGSGLTMLEWTKNSKACAPGEGTPSFIGQDDIGEIVTVGNWVVDVFNATGVLTFISADNSRTAHLDLFMDGKAVMGVMKLGEMESERMRSVKFKRGILPFPRYDLYKTKNFTTVVHDQAEVDSILITASSFATASAFLQYVNEESEDVLDTYYEDVLKFKYNDSRGARKMIDIVRETTASPLDTVVLNRLFGQATNNVIYDYFLEDAKVDRDCTFSSTYAGIRDSLQTTLESMLADFNKRP